MKLTITTLLLLFICLNLSAQKKSTAKNNDSTPLEALDLSGLKFRTLGPALTSGRISEFAVNPNQPKEYYVATSSGGVWKTINAGITYSPIFDNQGSYSIGCITMDPNNSEIIWVGTGENNNQRSVGYGDGVYKSIDGGKNWEHMGLKDSEHIGRIMVHPDNSNTIYVAAIGPLWSAGGDRGVYKSEDGGKNWNRVLDISEHTGVNDLVMHPQNPEILYAAAFQRRRHVFTYLGGGPESSIYKSTDGGSSWEKIDRGLPKVDLGRIGLAISPADPSYIYAIVEAALDEGGVYRSNNQGASWEKMGKYVSSGNYYQELVPDPEDPLTIYAMDTWMQISEDGGKNFKHVGEDFKHIDNHALWIDPEDTEHLLVGCDGGIYESWDRGKNWDFKTNLPITQFYKVSVDNREPFYYIYGGTQDNFSLGGPSRTISGQGIVNEDWFVTHGGDGFETQIDPNNPDIIYAQSQYGNLVRYDHRSGEEKGIQPQARKGENAYRWNWDAPLAVSVHHDSRLYFAANKLFRSEDRGDSWQVISEDLTRQINRNELPVMGRTWSVDAVAKNQSTSPYGTIVAFSESPKNPNLLFVGTDDGLIQVTEDGGNSWRKIDQIPGVPNRAYVNMLWASQHDENVVYACFNHHKYGDFMPYVFKSTNKGQTWTNISANLPTRGSSYAIAEDFIDRDLLFVGTEFGVFFSRDGKWKQLKSGVPVIAVRDLAIQSREGDLILGTFGRGFYVLDDYSVLRNISNDLFEKQADLFMVRDALLFENQYPLGLPGKSFQGDNYYTGDNLGSEAIFTYYLQEKIQTKSKIRREEEKKNKSKGSANKYPSYDQLKAEKEESDPYLLFTVRDQQGNVVRKLTTKAEVQGIQRIKWDLRYPFKDPISLTPPPFYNPFSNNKGTLVEPGTYTVTFSKMIDGEVIDLDEPESFEVIPLDNYALPAADRSTVVSFQKKVNNLSRAIKGAQKTIDEIENQIKHIKEAISLAESQEQELIQKLELIKTKLYSLKVDLNDDPVASALDIDKPPTPASRVQNIVYEQSKSTTAPTATHTTSLTIAEEEFLPMLQRLQKLINTDLKSLQEELERAGAPYTPYTVPQYTGN